MYRLLVAGLLFFVSCQSLTEEQRLHKSLAGQWLILYPDEQLKDGQEVIYGKIQDSIVALTGLKLVILSEDGVFRQLDSINKKGRWGMSPDHVVFIENGGREFDNFTAKFKNYHNGILELSGSVEAEDEKIELTWKMKKITGGTGAGLFEDKNNQWRLRPNQPESETQIRKRLGDMLRYYSDYYHLIAKEASFFIPARIILPFEFYRHAMGMAPLREESVFVGLFFNLEQARQAHHYLSVIIKRLRDEYPTETTYGEEYAGFMKKMAKEIARE